MPSDRTSEGKAAGKIPRKVYRVSEISQRIKILLEEELGSIWLEGECSNVSRPASGHTYFTLKDETSQIKAALFKGDERNVKVVLRDGQKVRVYGHITAWEKSSTYQLIVRLVEDAGAGALQAAFEQLKRQLAAEGLFDAGRKMRLPLLPRCIGVVTSPTGAAIRDIIQVLTRRYPNVHVILAPVKVQGEGSATSIANAINYFARAQIVDVLIIGRGGGSLEDLWSFNEEVVARAIADCPIPIVSAVGHEIDFTISDFVADVRAPTPSAAAELVVPMKQELEDRVARDAMRLGRALETRVLQFHNRLTRAAGSYVFREPQNLVLQYRQTLDHLQGQMRHSLSRGAGRQREKIGRLELKLGHLSQSRVREGQRRIQDLEEGLEYELRMQIRARRQTVEQCRRQLGALSPFNVLERGFSITRKSDGMVVKTVEDVAEGEHIQTILGGGSLIESTVTRTNVEEEKNGRQK